jgi:hypothetical protein
MDSAMIRATCRKWERFWYPSTDAVDLGFARFLFFAWFLYSTWRKDFVVWANLPLELFSPLPFMKLVNYQVVSASTVHVLQSLWRLSLFLGCIGFATRISALAACCITTYLWSLTYGFSQETHGSIALIFTSLVLAVSRSADAFSL